VQVIGTQRGSYGLEIRPQDEKGDSLHSALFEDIPTKAGEVHVYRLAYTRAPEVPLQVSGGFDGEGERPSDGDRILTYANPISPQTQLKGKRISFALILFYGGSIAPRSIKATLDGRDISRRFIPKPGGFQVVPLDLSQGSHTLVLSAQGTVSPGRTATDTDRLMFLVR
jgi:hypothetical protein